MYTSTQLALCQFSIHRLLKIPFYEEWCYAIAIRLPRLNIENKVINNGFGKFSMSKPVNEIVGCYIGV